MNKYVTDFAARAAGQAIGGTYKAASRWLDEHGRRIPEWADLVIKEVVLPITGMWVGNRVRGKTAK